MIKYTIVYGLLIAKGASRSEEEEQKRLRFLSANPGVTQAPLSVAQNYLKKLQKKGPGDERASTFRASLLNLYEYPARLLLANQGDSPVEDSPKSLFFQELKMQLPVPTVALHSQLAINRVSVASLHVAVWSLKEVEEGLGAKSQ